MEQHPEQYNLNDISISDLEKEEVISEPSLMDRISGWFTEDNVI